ncbi:hypothetical protein RRG08_003641 [Elysia crispata]|uniref:Uncharacterized protein n=1 Tax=Elysia crispata TaxID=231223 RepID=A0AAE1E6B5_9GAST|nr:hypothetical protein RRG08_003641 [Elysia crispata]
MGRVNTNQLAKCKPLSGQCSDIDSSRDVKILLLLVHVLSDLPPETILTVLLSQSVRRRIYSTSGPSILKQDNLVPWHPSASFQNDARLK